MNSSIREIPSLQATILRTIAKSPSQFLNETRIQNVFRLNYNSADFDYIQAIVDSVTDAGRFTDEAVPVSLFRNRSMVAIRNAKVSGIALLFIMSFST
jgi:hypothetical protein